MTRDKVAVIDPSNFTPPYDHHLCEALSDTGWKVKLFTSSETKWTPNNYQRVQAFYPVTEGYFGSVGPDGICLFTKGLEHVVGMLQLVRRLWRWNPDVIHFQWLPLPFVDVPLLRLIRQIAPTVLTVHDSTPFQGSATSSIQQIMVEKGPKVVDEVIVHTQKTKDELVAAGVHPTDISIIPHGVIRYPLTEESPMGNSDKTTVLFFGNIKPYKGVDVLIDAVARLPPEMRKTLRVVVAGRPHGQGEELKQRAREQGVTDLITWELGFIKHKHVAKYFEQSDIIVFPYRNIDQSGVLMTALPFGKPVIATQVGGFTDVLTDGIHGRLIPPNDAVALSRALSELLTNEDSLVEMGDAVKELANETHSWSRIAKITTDRYCRIIQNE